MLHVQSIILDPKKIPTAVIGQQSEMKGKQNEKIQRLRLQGKALKRSDHRQAITKCFEVC